MQSDDVRAMSDKDLAEELEKARLAHFNVRFSHSMGRLPDTNRLREAKREIARLLTVRRERELWAQYEAAKANAGKE